jgi:hypothetical protein
MGCIYRSVIWGALRGTKRNNHYNKVLLIENGKKNYLLEDWKHEPAGKEWRMLDILMRRVKKSLQ